MRKLLTIAAASFAALTAVPASAVTYSVGDFATPGSGSPFSYAQYSGGTATLFTFGCPARPDLGTCAQGTDTAAQAHVAYDGGPNLIVHPGTSQTTAVLFTAPTAGTYTFMGAATLLSSASNGVTFFGVRGTSLTSLSEFAGGTLLPNAPTFPFMGSITLAANEIVGVVFGNNGNNSNDSVLVSGTAAIPEPGTWALMIGGAGLVGGAMRRRSRQERAALA